MSDSVTNPVGNADPRSAAATGIQNANAPLPELFANVLNKTSFAEKMFSQFDIGLARAADRDFEARPDVYQADHADVEPIDDGAAEVSETDEQSDDGAEPEAQNQGDDQPQEDGGEAGSEQASAAILDESLLALNTAGPDTDKPGLSVQPNTASGVVLQSKTEGPTPGQARATTNGGEVHAAAHKTVKANHGQAPADGATARGNSAFGHAQSDAGARQPDAATIKPGQNPDGAAAKAGLNVDPAAAETSPAKGGPVLLQAQAALEGDAEGLGPSLERHALLIRAGAKRAAELHQMKIRLSAHRDAIKKAIAQSDARSNGAQPQNSASSAAKPTIEVTTSATPPAPLPSSGPAARPAPLFNTPLSGALPGQAGANGSSNLAVGDIAGNGAEQSAAADRQTATSSTARGLGPRPTPSQLPYQPAEQVKVHIQQLAKSGADRIQVRLSPASLGRVDVTLELTPDKTVQAIVYAEKPETLDMLERDARVLQQAFEEAGMKFASDGLTFKHGQPGDADAKLADGTGSGEDGTPADGEELDGDDTADNNQPRRRQHDGMLDLEI